MSDTEPVERLRNKPFLRFFELAVAEFNARSRRPDDSSQPATRKPKERCAGRGAAVSPFSPFRLLGGVEGGGTDFGDGASSLRRGGGSGGHARV